MGGLGFGQGYFGQYSTGGTTAPEFNVVLFTTESYAASSWSAESYAASVVVTETYASSGPTGDDYLPGE